MLKAAEISGFPAGDTPNKKTDDRGLYLLIKPNGSKLWYFKYRFGGKEKKLPIGQFPEIGLAYARRIRDAARVKIAEGLDPMLQRKREKMTARINSANSFELVALEYIEEKMVRQNLAETTLRKARWFLDLLRPGHRSNADCGSRSANDARPIPIRTVGLGETGNPAINC